jgi:hypothetical protein
VTLRLLEYCKGKAWTGHDPYDALNSRLIQYLPIRNSRFARIALTQLLKRSPIDFRRVLLVPESQNPKAIALILMALIRLSRLGILSEKDLIYDMINLLERLRSKGFQYYCWGYSFPWQTRTALIPGGYPNIICTVFAAKSLLEAYQYTGLALCRNMALSSAEYLIDDLYWMEGQSSAGFSYPSPGIHKHIYNANFLGAELLCRAFRLSGERKYLDPAVKVVLYAIAQQKSDGSWPYGELPGQQWVDNFHSGYNLSALAELNCCLESQLLASALRNGFDFYKRSFLKENRPPKYFHDKGYPIDIHCIAQSIITLIDLRDLDESNIRMASSILAWAMSHMWSPNGYFYYRVLPFYRNKLSYMRWSQAWMLLALATLIEAEEKGSTKKAADAR